MRTMEIEFGDEEAAPANTTNSSTGHSKSLLANLMKSSASSSVELQSRALAMNSAMVYLLQVGFQLLSLSLNEFVDINCFDCRCCVSSRILCCSERCW